VFTIFIYCHLILKTYYFYIKHFELIPLIKFSLIWPIIIINSILNNIFLLIDNLLFNFKNINIVKPLFIVGFPRSGTTFLHHSIYQDKQFTTPQLWELLFAPSIIQKLLWKNIIQFFNIQDSKNINVLKKITQKFDHIHEINLFNPEEDYLSFIPFGGCFLLIILMPIDEIWNLTNFDSYFSKKQQDKLMFKYKLLIKRHLFVYGTKKTYLSKNPYFTTITKTLNRTFPDCNIIGCHRKPEEAITSLLSNMDEAYKLMSRKIIDYNHVEKYVVMYKRFYDVMTQQEKTNINYVLLTMNEISQDLLDVIHSIYKQFNYTLDKKFEYIIQKRAIKSKNYKSTHKYNLSDYNLDSNYIDKLFCNIK
tara:strand:- start:479 stop:1567 length:1089 start_codon:yes stop_codon:yes gene_type:complete